MESVGTKPYRQPASDTVNFEAAAPHIVVVCPSCKTSFAVETAAVAALETPRFHCSRCDDIFIMKDAPADILPLGGVNVQSLAHPGHLRRSGQPLNRGPAPESLIKPSDFSLGTSTSAPKAFIEPNFDAPPEPGCESRSELSLLSKSVNDTPRDLSSHEEHAAFQTATGQTATVQTSVTFETPVTSSPSAMPVVEDRSPSHGFVVSPVATQTPSLSSRQFVLADPAPTLPDHALKPTRNKEQVPPLSRPVGPTLETPTTQTPINQTESYRPRRGETQSSSLPEPRRFSARTQSLISMGSPILAAMAVLLGVSYCAQVSPQSVDALMNYMTPSVLKESVQASPPSALGVKNLRIAFKKTRNREYIPVVTGTVLNDSGRAFEGVELEVIGFNGRGEIIASSRSPLRSSLTNENVSDLSIEAVANHQQTLSGKDSSIKAREAVSFTIALLNGRHVDEEIGTAEFDPSKVKYFSARIFSLKRPQ